MSVSEADVLKFLQRIETGEVMLNPMLDPQVHIKSDILYEASNGWTIEISNWGGEFSGIVGIVPFGEEELDMEYLEQHMLNVHLYFPNEKVMWRAYRMKAIKQKR